MTTTKDIIIKALIVLTVCFYYVSLTKGVSVSPESMNRLNAENNALVSFIKTAAIKHSVHPALIAAVIQAESNFNPKARSGAGAMGLMQITGPTGKYLRVTNLYNPWTNIEAGTRYLRELFVRFEGNVELAVAAYNAGPGAVSKYKGIPPYQETRNYVVKVMNLYKFYQNSLVIN